MQRILSWIAIVCALVLSLIVCVVLLAYDSTAFYLKEYTGTFLLSNIGALLVAIGVFGLLWFFLQKHGNALQKWGWRLPAVLSVLLLCMQIFVTYHAYFLSVWDARYVFEGAWAFAYRQPEIIAADYFEIYPNNLALVGIFGWLLRLPMFFGVELGQQRGLLLLILVQCALNTVSGLILWSLIQHGMQSIAGFQQANLAALMGWLFYAVLIGTSPWFLVPYSDAMALILPLLILWVYQRIKKKWIMAVLLGALGAVAYLIKPQACIPMIAIALYEMICLVSRPERERGAFLLLLAASFVLVCFPVQAGVEREIGLSLDDEQAVTVAHYLNMGLNDPCDGAYYFPDLEAALAIEGRQERTKWCLASAMNRIKAYGPGGVGEHLLKKALVNFSDGGFAWGVDFARNELPLKDEQVSSLVRSVVYSDGELYPWLHTVEQGTWLLLLLLAAVSAGRIAIYRHLDPMCIVLLLSVLGIVAFNMLFEAKARYMYVMVPIMIALAVTGTMAPLRRTS